MNLLPWLLWLHIFGAIVAFGPTFTFPLIGGMGSKEPIHVNFALRVSARISHGIVWPLALVQGLTGLGLVLVSGRDLTAAGNYWLDIAIVLYLVALGFSYFVQTPRLTHLVGLTSAPPPPPAPGSAPAGPPPAVRAAAKAVQQGGMVMTGLVVSIIFLMVLKPGA